MRQLSQFEVTKKGGACRYAPPRRGKSDAHEAQADHAARQFDAVERRRAPQAHGATRSSGKSPSQRLQRQCGCGSGTSSGCDADALPSKASSIDNGRNQAAASAATTRSTVVSQDGDVETRTQAMGGPGGPASVAPLNQCAPSGAFTSIPSNVTLAARLIDGVLQAPFTMHAKFDAPIPCTCSYGEYRQYVRGAFTAGGNPVTHSLGAGRNLNPTVFQEDGDPAAGTAYGYRSSPGTKSRFLPDQAGGCRFKGEDEPGIRGSSGTDVMMNLDFIGTLIDTSDSNRVVAESEWSVGGSATMP